MHRLCARDVDHHSDEVIISNECSVIPVPAQESEVGLNLCPSSQTHIPRKSSQISITYCIYRYSRMFADCTPTVLGND